MYPWLLLAGLTGLVAMLALGATHGPAVRHGRASHAGHLHAHRGPGPRTPTARHTARAGGRASSSRAQRGFAWLGALASPLPWFAGAVGAGAAGRAATALGSGPGAAAVAAVLGAASFHLLVVKPVSTLVAEFATPPAGNLEACLFQDVEAVTAFDARGQGLVRVLVDGRSEDVLATLDEADRRSGLRVRRGDRLVVRDVDPRAHRCLVARS